MSTPHPEDRVRHRLGPGVLLVLILFWVVTAIDITDHIRRAGSVFAEHPFAWTAFSVAAGLVVSGVLLLADQLLGRKIGAWRVVTNAAAIALAFVLHVFATGPILAALLFPYTSLEFTAPWALAGLAAAASVLLAACSGAVRAGWRWLRRRRGAVDRLSP